MVIRLLDDGHSDIELEATMDSLIWFPFPRVVQVVGKVKAQGLILLAIRGEVALLAALDEASLIKRFRLIATVYVLAAEVRCVVAACFLRPVVSLLTRDGIWLLRFLGLRCNHNYVETFGD